jgi:hypothetical protein
MTETKRYIDGTPDWFVCICGNQPNYDGFYSCLTDGTIVSPTLDGEWNGETYICERCQRIIDGNTLEVTGVAGDRVAYKNMRYNWDNY